MPSPRTPTQDHVAGQDAPTHTYTTHACDLEREMTKPCRVHAQAHAPASQRTSPTSHPVSESASHCDIEPLIQRSSEPAGKCASGPETASESQASMAAASASLARARPLFRRHFNQWILNLTSGHLYLTSGYSYLTSGY